MDDITLNLIVLAGFALLGGLVFLLVRRKQASEAQAVQMLAAEKGWKVESIREPLLWGQRLTSPRWTLESVSRTSGKESGPGSSDISMLTVWQANIPGATILIGERQSQADIGAFGEMLMRQVLQQALGADADGLTEVKAGSEAFQQKYMLWAQKPEDVRITSGIEAALLSWKGNKPLIRRTSEGLNIEQQGVQIKTRFEFEQIINLGEMLSKILEAFCQNEEGENNEKRSEDHHKLPLRVINTGAFFSLQPTGRRKHDPAQIHSRSSQSASSPNRISFEQYAD